MVNYLLDMGKTAVQSCLCRLTMKQEIKNMIKIVDKKKIIQKVYTRLIYMNYKNFVNNAEMTQYVDEWIKQIGSDFDVVSGVPRSGLMIAALIATKLGKPLLIEAEGGLYKSKLIPWKEHDEKMVERILVVDDCITTGASLNKWVEYIKSEFIYRDAQIIKGALFVQDSNKHLVDTYYKVFEGPQLFQWNLMHYKVGVTGYDMDGVLCEECSQYKDMNEEEYLNFIDNAKPYLIPTYEIDYIVTCRLERYRPRTEAWLKKHGVKYKQLVMWDLPKKSMRTESFGDHKAKEINKTNIEYFIESEEAQAIEIAKHTKVKCICTDTMKMM